MDMTKLDTHTIRVKIFKLKSSILRTKDIRKRYHRNIRAAKNLIKKC